jgi:hypothetical protein
MLVEDGMLGVNPQGIDSTHEGCNPLINDLTGKIAVVYRNTCYFSAKVYYAEQSGALAVVVVNREDALIGMQANTDPVNGPLGTECTIPAVALSSIDGAVLTSAMENGPVTLFIGNKFTAFSNDVGANASDVMSAKYGSIPSSMADDDYSFQVGLQVVNFGSEDNTINVTATVDGSEGNVYSNTVSAFMASGDTLPIFNGNGVEFPLVSNIVWQEGNYKLTYVIDIEGQTDESTFDNVFTRDFSITSDVLSLAHTSEETQQVAANSYPYNADFSYTSCMLLQDSYPAGSNTGIEGVYFALSATDSILEGKEILMEAYEWNDAWTDLSGGWASITFDGLNPVGYGTYVPGSNDEYRQVVYAPFQEPISIYDEVRYLVCLTTYTEGEEQISFGYDNTLNYDANQSIYSQPINPLNIPQTQGQDTWYPGWNGYSALSLGLKMNFSLGIDESSEVSGTAYPNPAVDNVTIDIDGEGPAVLIVSDIAGKIVFSNNVVLNGGKSNVDVSSLVEGMYLFNVTLENGNTSTFSVVKK